MELRHCTVAVIAADGFEESELTEPVRALRNAGAHVDILSMESGEIQAVRHHDKTIRIRVDKRLDEVRPDTYDAVVLPGGALNADQLRVEPKVQHFITSMQEAGKPIAAICHAPWELVSAGLVRGRRLTAYHTIRDDIQNAGGHFLDQEVVLDGNWVTSRQPSDLPAFNREMLKLFSQIPAHASR